MPELPDLVHVENKLRQALLGRVVQSARTGDPTVLRLMVQAPFPGVLIGRRFRQVERRGHFVCLHFDGDPNRVPTPPRGGPRPAEPGGSPRDDDGDLSVAINCMLTGRFVLAAPDDKSPRSLALALAVEPPDGGDQAGGGAPAALELRYVDDKRMGKVYVVPTGKLGDVPVLGALGVDLLSPAFTLDAFRAIVKRRRDQVRQFLMDKRALASIGNAYADEILFTARLHPKTFVNKLAPQEIDALYAAIRDVTANAITEIARRDQPVEVKVRDFLSVRGRAGKPCPRCGTTIREVRVGDGDACFCPQCQPATRSLFVDWRKLPGSGSGS
jgi:formamidopyrimidine-DNA glycosylase